MIIDGYREEKSKTVKHLSGNGPVASRSSKNDSAEVVSYG